MTMRLLLIISIALCGCDDSQSRGESDSCEEELRTLLPHWHLQVRTAAQQAQQLAAAKDSDGNALARAQLSLQLSSWAASSATLAHLRYRVYGGNVSRNRAKGLDAAAERRRAKEAAKLALEVIEAPPLALRKAVDEMAKACR